MMRDKKDMESVLQEKLNLTDEMLKYSGETMSTITNFIESCTCMAEIHLLQDIPTIVGEPIIRELSQWYGLTCGLLYIDRKITKKYLEQLKRPGRKPKEPPKIPKQLTKIILIEVGTSLGLSNKIWEDPSRRRMLFPLIYIDRSLKQWTDRIIPLSPLLLIPGAEKILREKRKTPKEAHYFDKNYEEIFSVVMGLDENFSTYVLDPIYSNLSFGEMGKLNLFDYGRLIIKKTSSIFIISRRASFLDLFLSGLRKMREQGKTLPECYLGVALDEESIKELEEKCDKYNNIRLFQVKSSILANHRWIITQEGRILVAEKIGEMADHKEDIYLYHYYYKRKMPPGLIENLKATIEPMPLVSDKDKKMKETISRICE